MRGTSSSSWERSSSSRRHNNNNNNNYDPSGGSEWIRWSGFKRERGGPPVLHKWVDPSCWAMRRTKRKRKKRKAAAPAEAIAPQGADKEKLHQCLSSLSFSLFLLRERVGRATASYKPDRDWGAPIRQVVAAMTVRDAGASACLPACLPTLLLSLLCGCSYILLWALSQTKQNGRRTRRRKIAARRSIDGGGSGRGGIHA